jgi:hypothetical protein
VIVPELGSICLSRSKELTDLRNFGNGETQPELKFQAARMVAISPIGVSAFPLFQFFGEPGLPVLSRMENVQQMYFCLIEIVDGNMTVPSRATPDDDVSQVRSAYNLSSFGVRAAQVGDGILQEPKIFVGVVDAVKPGVPLPDLLQFINRGGRANDR